MVGGEDDRALGRDVLAADAAHAEVDVEERLQDRRAAIQYTSGFTPLVRVRSGPSRSMPWIRAPGRGVTVPRWRSIARAPCAGPSPARSPPGRGRPGAPRPARLRRRLPRQGAARQGGDPRARRGPSPASRCTCSTARPSAPSTRTSRRGCRCPPGRAVPRRAWSSTWRRGRGRPIDRVHPARDDLPKLSGNAAFAQATWRHLVFGVVLGELERRFNDRGHGRPPLRARRLLQRPRRHRARRGRVGA